MKLNARKDVPVNETWDLSLIFAAEADFEAAVEKAKALADTLEKTYKNALTTPESIAECLALYEELEILLYQTTSYTSLAVSVDYTDTEAQKKDAKMTALAAEIGSRLSFIESEIADAPEELIRAAMDKTRRAKHYLAEILREKPHRLSAETEKVLAALSPVFNAPYDIYHMTKLADMKFGSFTVNGREYPLGYSLFEDEYEYEADTDVRRAAFRAFSDKLREYENTTAATYNTYLTQQRIMAKQRGFADMFDADLFTDHVTREMYDRQIDLITEKLAPAMRKYARLVGKMNKLDRVTFADLKLPLDAEFDPRVTIGESREYVRSALSVLGQDYADMVDEAYDKRWIDFARNVGKETGGFCSSPYGCNSYILLSWNNRMADVFTIAHELGHAGHFRLCNGAQSLFDTNVSGYLIEAPSTMNELLLAQDLLRKNTDKRFRRWVLSSLIGHTYYHNFVTHLREAWYQREAMNIIEQGGAVNAETLSGIFRKNLETFWGDAVELTEGCELTWMRQPHYYMGLYSYTYSAGLTLATQAALNIAAEGESAVARWRAMLEAGSTHDPLGLAAIAGIDLSTPDALEHTIAYISGIIDEIAALTEEIDGITLD
ncbi:MAG TPA: oligoendopeptidase F [Clostridiales bacterium]|nr:oligoendopeptidase F [Clostridiales bacterium]